jgi:hypothetical protein
MARIAMARWLGSAMDLAGRKIHRRIFHTLFPLTTPLVVLEYPLL